MTKKCKDCGSKLIIEKTPETIHHARKDCPTCGFQGWMSKPDNENKRTKTSNRTVKDVADFHNQDEKRCFFCRRKKEQLNKNETLTLDHIQELNNGGKDKIENLQILCTACHKLKNHQRLYHNWHRYGGENG